MEHECVCVHMLSRQAQSITFIAIFIWKLKSDVRFCFLTNKNIPPTHTATLQSKQIPFLTNFVVSCGKMKMNFVDKILQELYILQFCPLEYNNNCKGFLFSYVSLFSRSIIVRIIACFLAVHKNSPSIVVSNQRIHQ